MSNTYVKKYDVGQIKLDLPYANYIHELPLLSFGDVQHTINLNLVFNEKLRKAGDNSFNIAEGFKLNMQKRVVVNNTATTIKFEEGNGKCIDLIRVLDFYTFDDETQRVLRCTSSGYELEYPDFSKEIFNDDGYIIGAYSKYDKINPLIAYGYENGKLTSINYRGKIISFGYDTLNKLSSITYANKTITFTYVGDYHLVVSHYSEVDYNYSATNEYFSIYSANSGESSSDPCSHKWMCTKATNSITIEKIVAGETIDNATYDFLSFNGDKITLLDASDKNGVKTRVHFKDNKLLYFYETGLPNNGFLNDKYCGNVNVQSVFNNKSGVYSKLIQKPNSGASMTAIDQMTEFGWTASLPSSAEYDGIYILSGWIKSNEDNDSDTIQMIIGKNSSDLMYSHYLPKPPVNEWTYFAVGFPYTFNTICAYFKKYNTNIETKDFRITFQQSFVNDTTCIDELVYEEDVLIMEDTNGNSIKYLSLTKDCQFCNGSTNISGNFTMHDILQYKINQMYGTHKNIIFYDNYKNAVTDVDQLCVKYTENDTIHTEALENFAVGKRRYANGKIYVTKTNFYPINDKYALITKMYINEVNYKDEVYNDKLDIVSSTVEDTTVHYDYVSELCGLISRVTTAPKGVDKLDTTRADVMVTEYNYDDTLTKLTSVIDEFGNTTYYTTDDVWGAVTGVTLPSGTVITDAYDDDRCALLSREFSNATNARRTSFSYSDGNLAGFTHTDTVDSISFTYTYDKDKIVNMKKGTSTIEEHEHTDTTLDSYYPTKASNVYSVLSDFDEYGRLTKTDNLVENVYDVKPEYDSNGDLIIHSANASAVLATSKDLTNNQTSKYHYDAHRQLSKKEIENSAGTVISEETFGYDEIGRLTTNACVYDKVNSKSVRSEILYERAADNPLADNVVNRYSYYLNGATSPIAQTGCDFDSYNRVTAKYQAIDGKEFVKNITYDKTRPTRLLETLNGRPLCNINYQYDAMGRINSISGGGGAITYEYDNYGQLVRENNKILDKSFQYVYNGIGNITSINTYAYTPAGTELSGTPTTTAFTYNASKPDVLANVGGSSVTFNANGELRYYKRTYNFENGKLRSFFSGSTMAPMSTYEECGYRYNALGQRVTKTYQYDPNTSISDDGSFNYTKTYTYDHSGRLINEKIVQKHIFEVTSTREIMYLYDESGMIGFKYIRNGVDNGAYYYQRNLQGDVVAIYNANGVVQVEYAYDAWGNCTTTYSANDDIANDNPIRYRGYYFDVENNFYYLNARYYSPELRRFISPDDTSYLDPESVNGLNLYCYCNNDPVNATITSEYFNTNFINNSLINSNVGFNNASLNHIKSLPKLSWLVENSTSIYGALSSINSGIPIAHHYLKYASIINDEFRLYGISKLQTSLQLSNVNLKPTRLDGVLIGVNVALDMYDSIQRGVSANGVLLGGTLTAASSLGMMYLNKGIMWMTTTIGTAISPGLGTAIGFSIGVVSSILADIFFGGWIADWIDRNVK